MSSQPPYPPYDPQMQWRTYRAQQRAARYAQREAWRAQRRAWKMQMGYTPRVPSIVGPILLIAIGVIWLLVYSGRIPMGTFATWYGHWWPMLLILAGIGLLVEWALDMRRATPVRRSGGFVGILILLAFFGMCSTVWAHHGAAMTQDWTDNGDNWFNFFGEQHDYDQPSQQVELPAGGIVQIDNPHGDVNITAGDGSTVSVANHENAFAESDSAARSIFEAEKAQLTLAGTSAQIKSNDSGKGRVNMTVTVPKSAQVVINAAHGDVTLSGVESPVTINAARGDVNVSAIKGTVTVHFSSHKGDFSAHQIDGDLIADGNCNDVTLSNISGKTILNGDIFGDTHLESLTGPLHIHTSVTDLEVAALPGDLTLDSDDLRVTDAKGALHVTTREKDVDASQIYGDVSIDDNRGDVSVAPAAGMYSVDARSGKGDIEVTLPPDASVTVDGHTRNGDILSDFPLSISGDDSKSVSGKIGAGAGHVNLKADVGDVHIKRGTGYPPAPPAPAEGAAPAAPPKALTNAPHLKAPKSPAPPPITQ